MTKLKTETIRQGEVGDGYNVRVLYEDLGVERELHFRSKAECDKGLSAAIDTVREQLLNPQTVFDDAGFEIREIRYTYGWLETVTNNISYWITRAEMKNKMLYALVFPLLNLLSYLGRNSRPTKGAGVLAVATRNT